MEKVQIKSLLSNNIDLYKIDMICFGIIVCLFFVLYFFIQKFPIFITRNSNENE